MMTTLSWAVRSALLLLATLSPVFPAQAQDTDAKPLEQPAAPAPLTLDQALAEALEKSPALRASRSRADAATASRSQTGVLPNPEFSIEAENIYGDGP